MLSQLPGPAAAYTGAQARFYDSYFTGLDGEVEFYVAQASACGGPVLEAGCGTGRTLFPVAAAGIDISGLELSPDMVAQARQRRADLPEQVRRRVTITEGDMRDLPADLGTGFRLISLPYRTFQHLLTTEDQLTTLHGFRKRLAPGGRLVLNLFDPTADMVRVLNEPEPSDDIADLPIDMEFPEPEPESGSGPESGLRSGSGRQVRVRYRRGYALEAQILHQVFFYEILDNGTVVDVERGELMLRYTYRFEMEHLLRLAGFSIVSLAGDFEAGPYAGYGEQVWVAEAQ